MILILLGIGLVTIHFFTSQLSHQFIFGQGYQQRPIITFVVLMGLAGIFYVLALELIRRHTVILSHPKVLMFICLTALMMRLVYSHSDFIQETDPYRYIWDGQAMIQRVNPYTHSPQEAMKHNIKPASNKPITQDVYKRINHEGIKTIYPPFAQGLFALSQWLTPWKITGWKWMVTLTDCAVIGLLIVAFGHLGLPKSWVLAYAWSPLVVKEFSNSVHMDVFALLMLGLMIYALARGWQMAAYIALAGAVLIKLFAIILLPVLIFGQLRNKKRYLFQGLLIFFSVLILSYWPFLNAGVALTEGLRCFLTEWQTNEGLFGLIRWVASLLPLDEGLQMIVSRIFSAGLLCLCLIGVVSWLRKENGIHSLMKALGITLAILFFLLPTGNPWYYTWVLLFIPFLPLRALILFSVLVFIYYLDFFFLYHDAHPMFVWARWVEYGLFYSILGVELWRQRLPSLSRS
ncbi:MAG: hypothetical protein KGJ11_00330 [Candidatus Omnitrophica bacterium]|nr:hypothetical protein [Candidatus Omnitrophota bacterium]